MNQPSNAVTRMSATSVLQGLRAQAESDMAWRILTAAINHIIGNHPSSVDPARFDMDQESADAASSSWVVL